jgi:hypothetical protein
MQNGSNPIYWICYISLNIAGLFVTASLPTPPPTNQITSTLSQLSGANFIWLGMDKMAHKIVTIRVTEEQLMAIEYFFIHYDWELEILKEEVDEADIEEPDTEQVVENVATIPAEAETVSDLGQQDNPNNPSFDNTSNDDEDFCYQCFSSPCVTRVTQGWFGKPQRPREGNNLVRKSKYKLFWKMLDNRGVWRDPRYQTRKMGLLHINNGDDEHVVWTTWTTREVMPVCVLGFVRGMYPNPPGVQYMGHKWQ